MADTPAELVRRLIGTLRSIRDVTARNIVLDAHLTTRHCDDALAATASLADEIEAMERVVEAGWQNVNDGYNSLLALTAAIDALAALRAGRKGT